MQGVGLRHRAGKDSLRPVDRQVLQVQEKVGQRLSLVVEQEREGVGVYLEAA